MSPARVELSDQLSIDTPELVQLEFSVAGLGSRALACLIDYLLQGTVFTLLFVALVLIALAAPETTSTTAQDASSPGGVWVTAIVLLIIFLFQWGYFTLFEAFWNGQTPGKRLLRLRVIEQSGRSVSFLDSLSRNLLRVVDMLPGFYLVGMIFVFTSRRCQRLGDMVAGTLVIHEKKIVTPMWDGNAARHLTASLMQSNPTESQVRSSGLPADLVARLSLADVEVLENFEERRLHLPYETSLALAAKLAGQMAQKMGTPVPEDISTQDFLSALAFERRAMGRPSTSAANQL